jgi:hypothetical protein
MTDEALAEWKLKLFEVSRDMLIRRDKARRKIELERLVRDEVERDLLTGPEIKNESVGK